MDKTENLKGIFIPRDLSWLAFNERVLQEAMYTDNPLLERLRFLCIASNNMDEFFMVRVAGLKRLIDAGFNHKDAFGYYPVELLSEIHCIAKKQIHSIHEIYKGHISKGLHENRIKILKPREFNSEQKKSVERYFDTVLFPVLTPLGVDTGHPFPTLHSKTKAFAVRLVKEGHIRIAIVVMPAQGPHLFQIPSEKGEYAFAPVEDIIRGNMEKLFRGYTISECFAFRVIRDSELSLSEEYESDILEVIKTEIKKRPSANVVSLQVECASHSELLALLQKNLDFPPEETLHVGGTVDILSLCEITSLCKKSGLIFRSHMPAGIVYENIFDRIGEGDFILHLPYQSFLPVVDLIQSAAKDKNVLAIKITLYRTDENSKIIQALATAAKSGKQVTAVVELKARFDEAKNIEWTGDLESAGCHVIYGIPGIKIHCKMMLIVRKEEGRIARYVHLSTGNYNEKTANVYTDVGYFTKSEDFGSDISELFNVITGYSVSERWRRIISSPADMRNYFTELIDREIEFQNKYGSGMIFLKINSLEDVRIIRKLYEASAAGVDIKLIVRGICCLIPGIEGLSHNIKVKSIVGRFLEHSRIFIFNNNSQYRVFMASADWMGRNFDRRVELMHEIARQDIKEHLKYMMDMYWKDNEKSWLLTPEGKYEKSNEYAELFNVQEFLMEHYQK